MKDKQEREERRDEVEKMKIIEKMKMIEKDNKEREEMEMDGWVIL